MEKREDKRVTRTRRMLRQALVNLMMDKPVSGITVKELCEACEINRGTFYAHYSDVSSLLVSIEEELFAKLQQMLAEISTRDMLAEGRTSPAIVTLFEFLRENEDICRMLLCDNGDPAFIERVRAFVRTEVISDWKQLFAENDEEMREYTLAFLVAGSIGLLQRWLDGGLETPPSAVAEMLTGFITKGVSVLR